MKLKEYADITGICYQTIRQMIYGEGFYQRRNKNVEYDPEQITDGVIRGLKKAVRYHETMVTNAKKNLENALAFRESLNRGSRDG